MLSITKKSGNRVDIDLSGKLDAEGMRTALDELFEASQDVQKGRMLYTITNFSIPSAAAIGVELTRLPKLFRLLSKFDKCAVVCDAAWIRKAADVEGAIFPGIDIKSFTSDERGAAEAWLSTQIP